MSANTSGGMPAGRATISSSSQALSRANDARLKGSRSTYPLDALPAEERCVEQYSECAERLAAPLGPEPEEHDVPGIELDVERRGLSVQVFLADQIPRTQG